VHELRPDHSTHQHKEIVVTVFNPAVTAFNQALPVLDEQILLRELNHRVNNEFTSAINLVSVAAVRAEGSEAKAALTNVVELLHGYADVHRALVTPDRETLVDAAGYARKLGFAMSRSLLSRMNIRLACVADTLPLASERCWRLGLIVHELVTNSAKHARFDGRDGAIRIELTRVGGSVNCTVSDNGSASARFEPGTGLRIVSELAKGLDGRIEHGFDAKFRSVVLVFPLTERERWANSAAASCRMRQPRQLKAGPLVPRSLVPERRPQITAPTRSVARATQRI
jgi:two-component sensor histidine kinase